VDVETDLEVLIAGAGPVGLALALELQRFGIRLRIVEKKPERSTTSKALGLQPRLSEVFAILGVAGQFFARGFDGVRALNLRSGAKKLLSIKLQFPPNLAGREALQPRLIMIPQSVTEEILETTLAERGHLVERRRELVGFSQDRDSVSAMIHDEAGGTETIRAKFLVSCEGAHSVVRKQAGFTFTGATFPLRTLLADVSIDWDLPDNEVHTWFHRDGAFAALPFGGQKWRLIAECAEDPGDASTEVTLEQMEDLMIQRTGQKGVRLRDPLWLSDFRINARMVDSVSSRPGLCRRRRGPYSQSGRRPGNRDGHSGRGQSCLETRGGLARRRARLAPRYLRRGTQADCARSASTHERGHGHPFRAESDSPDSSANGCLFRSCAGRSCSGECSQNSRSSR
jgi:2-polyprenyl-6-methoxyphenol hydroxylase-like FAD-dependent oxidoreductase